MGMHTPWGAAQTQRQIARGIIEVSTAGHGGIHLSPTLNAKVHPAWRDRKGWYEKDCEWAFVAITFPQHFRPERVEDAHKTAKDGYPDRYEQVFGVKVTAAESSVRAEQEFRVANAERWVVDAAWGYRNDWRGRIPVPEGMVGVVARRPADRGAGEERCFLVPEAEYEGRHTLGSGGFATYVGNRPFVVDEARHRPWPERILCPAGMKPVNRIGRETLVSAERGHMLVCPECAAVPGTYTSADGNLRYRDHEPEPWSDVVGTAAAAPAAAGRELPPPGEPTAAGRWSLLLSVSTPGTNADSRARMARALVAVRRAHQMPDDASHDEVMSRRAADSRDREALGDAYLNEYARLMAEEGTQRTAAAEPYPAAFEPDAWGPTLELLGV